jgi:aspartate kinase
MPLEMERQLITGIAADKNEAKVTLTRVPDRPGAVAHIFGAARRCQYQRRHDHPERRRDKGETDVTFTVPQADLLRAHRRCSKTQKREAIGYNRMIPDTKVAKISVVGVGMRSHAGVAATMFSSLADRGSTSRRSRPARSRFRC